MKCLLLSVLILLVSAGAYAQNTISIDAAPIQLAPTGQTSEVWGVKRETLYRDATLQVYLDTRTVSDKPQRLLLVENCLNDVAAKPTVTYTINYDGKTYSVADHRRLRRVWFLLDACEFKPANLVQPNTFAWDGAYLDVKPLATAPVIPTGTDTRTTGARPCLGVRVPWGNSPLAAIQCGRVYGHLPITLRDKTTGAIVRDNTILLGYNPQKVPGVDPTQLGMKADTAHLWSEYEAYLAAKGTVLERCNAEQCEILACYCCMADYGGLWKKEVRGAGRSIRAAADWLNILRSAGLPEDPWVAMHLRNAWSHYEAAAQTGDVTSFYNGRRLAKENYYAVAGFEWAQLMFGLWQYEKYTGTHGDFLPAALDWWAQFPGIPYQIQLSDATGAGSPLWPMSKVIEQEAKNYAIEPKRYESRWPEQYVMDCIRVDLGKSPTKPLNSPDYARLLATTNSAGFWLPRPVQYIVTIGGQAMPPFSKDVDARAAAAAEVKRRIDAATLPYSDIVIIEAK